MGNRTTTLAVAGTILVAAAVLGVHTLRRHRTKHAKCALRAARRSPTRATTGQRAAPPPEPVPATIDVAVDPPARNGDRPPTPNLDRILAQRALEQRDGPD